jgi:L-alanine-DL-glutamate epimerase-like enolase superfamily enzyme
MAEAAGLASERPLLKVKLGGAGDPERIAAVRQAAPDAELIVDANEAWSADNLKDHLKACADAGVTLVEQPLPAGQDDALALMRRPVPVCADESMSDRASLRGMRRKYDAVNVKLDKTGGLTEALGVLAEAERLGFTIMVGCMLSTSLAIAPATLLTPRARIVDLDGPLLLDSDRPDGLLYEGSLMHPPTPALWG